MQRTRNTGALLAVLAIVLLAGIIGWRMWDSDPSATGDEDASAQSTAPTIEELAARAEANPDDPATWQELGLAYFTTNRFAEAVSAYERAVVADPESGVLWSSLGEARVMASAQDPMPPAAVEAFERAIALDSGDPRARYFLAVRQDLGGDHEGALAAWLALLADTPPGAPWESDLVRTIEQVAAINNIEVTDRIASAAATRDLLPGGTLPAQRGPTAEEIAAAGSIPPDEQDAMAQAMVARLATRLETDTDDIDGWIMLMRSYRQLGRDDDARAARERALAANPQSREQILDAARTLGVE